MNFKLLIIVALVATGTLQAPTSHAQTFTVNSTSDVDDRNDNNTQLTFREAVRRANETNGRATINFDNSLGNSPVITVTGGSYVITDDVDIHARVFSTDLTLNAGDNSRILMIDNGRNAVDAIRIYNVDFNRGEAIGDGDSGFGGAIFNQENLLLTDCSVRNSSASGLGGGVYNLGVFRTLRTTFQGNVSENGGGVCNAEDGSCDISRSTFTTNVATFDGGGLFNLGEAELDRNTFADNEAGGGGGLTNETSGQMECDRDEFTNNTADFGGAIDNSGVLELDQIEVRLNESVQTGGGISNFGGGQLTITRSELIDNVCFGFGGGIANEPGSTLAVATTEFRDNIGSTGGGVDNVGVVTIDESVFSGNQGFNGGAILNYEGQMTIQDSTITQNSGNQGGGIQTFADLNVVRCTIDRNSAEDFGGGISVDNGGELRMRNSTISQNTTQTYGAGVDNIGDVDLGSCTFTLNSAGASGDAFFAFQGTFSINNSIVNSDVQGAFTGSFNLFATSNAEVDVNGNNNTFSTAPSLGTLRDNGGPTQTHLPNANSPAINLGGGLDGQNVDQRGLPRVNGGRVDIGSVER